MKLHPWYIYRLADAVLVDSFHPFITERLVKTTLKANLRLDSFCLMLENHFPVRFVGYKPVPIRSF